jgi:preprotein translocase subunit SecB
MPEIKENSELTFNGIEIFNVQFNMEQEYDKETPIDLNMKPQVFFPDTNNKRIFSIVLDTTLEAKGFFVLSVSAVGNFTMGESVQEATQKQFIHVNAVAIMFPYIRAFIATLTANLGSSFEKITLPIHFFQGELEEYRQPENPLEMPQIQ